MLTAWSRWKETPRALLLVAGLTAAGLMTQVAAPEADAVVRTAVRVQVDSEAEREVVRAVMLDLWTDSDAAPRFDVVVDANDIERLREEGIEVEVLVPDVDALAAEERERLASAEAARPGNWFAEYRDYETVDAYLDMLAARRPAFAQVEELGASVEGRRIRTLKFSTGGEGRETIVLNGGQHAREWISVMATTCIADRIVNEYDEDRRIRAMLDRFDVYVAPVINPDGYVYSWESDRYWRKNRRGGYGVDLNRNWSVGFGGSGSSSNKRSQIFKGPRPFSEPETQALRDLIVREKTVAHIDFHSYGQMILYPWAYSKTPAPDRERLSSLANIMASAIARTHGKRYKPMTGRDLYTAGGTALDWSYGERNAAGYTIELRPDGGRRGFVLPPEQIVPTCDESFEAVLAMADTLDR
ncbi:MAG: M14 metallopeptidase family protein [Myxococcota bacterium]